METDNNMEFNIGRLTGQVSALITTINSMSTTINSLDTRLRSNEQETTKLTVKMALIAACSGALGSAIVGVVTSWLTK